ncbi:cytochrome c-type biogenesis protein [Rhodoligotrophos appendicifer]|uniref:cytochrome c-type biogenesis protein n=1 Tax=Rhodoligotrophos appendicifer TaxID=987056 RepID=UPI0011851517|nr:cytochrome c-type biogenesis protein [Rhodoligotrophos appendicifer]
MRRLILASLLALAMTVPTLAVQPDEVLPDAALEARARTLSAELRCLVCQNQSIDDSDAPLARDLRLMIRERLTAGDSDETIIDYVVSRYGEFVLLRPRFEPATWALWLTPFVLLLAGVSLVAMQRRRMRGKEPEAPLSVEEQARLERLLGE